MLSFFISNTIMLSANKFIDAYIETFEPDIEIQTNDDEKIKVHKIILTSHSSVFKNMLENCKNSETVSVDCEADIFKILLTILHYKYKITDLNHWPTFIKLVNLLDYYNFNELLDIATTVFNYGIISPHLLFDFYKQIINKSIKKSCLFRIFDILRIDVFHSLQSLVQSITCDEMAQIITEYKVPSYGKEKYILGEEKLYSFVCSWKSTHTDIENNEAVKSTIKNILDMIDIDKFKTSALVKHSTLLHKDYGDKFITVLLKKLNDLGPERFA